MSANLLAAPRHALARGALLLALVACGARIDAATFPNLYVVTVPLDPTARDQRAAATEAAFARLLVRVTGNRDAASDPRLAGLASEMAGSVNSYAVLAGGRAQVGFSARVDQALAERGVAVWGAERPLTLVWLVMDDGSGGRTMLSENGPIDELGAEPRPDAAAALASIRAELAAVADERGLPIAFPLLDLEDLTAVTFTDVWGGFDDRILPASMRYRADAVLVGRVRPGVVGYEIDWLLLAEGERRGLAGVAVRDGLDTVADLYASQLSVLGGASTELVTVRDVSTSAEYARVMSYLEGLSVLQSVDVESLDRGVLKLRVVARGDARVLERVLALGGVLRAEPSQPAAPTGGLQFTLASSGGPQ